MMDRTPGCAEVKIGVTEWNIDAGSWGLGRAEQATLRSALVNARLLQVFLRHCDKIKIACRSNLANSYCGATIETSPTGYGLLKRASYYIMELYQRFTLPKPLVIEQSHDGLDLFASASEDGKKVVVFAVNAGSDPVTLSPAFAGFTNGVSVVRAEAVSDTRNAGQPDIINHWDAPERIKINEVAISGNTVVVPGFSATAIQCRVGQP